MNEEMTMENTMAIRALKEKIKLLADLQHKTKLARKTTMPKEEWLALKNELAPKKASWDHGWAASDARLREAEITACLNYYHELRGSTYRHNADVKGYWYDKYLKETQAELAKLKS